MDIQKAKTDQQDKTGLSIVIVSCLIQYKRFVYLQECVEKIHKYFTLVGIPFEIVVCFDKIGVERLRFVDRIIIHNKGLGHSFNVGIESAKYDTVLQIEDDLIIDCSTASAFDLGFFQRYLVSENAIIRLYPKLELYNIVTPMFDDVYNKSEKKMIMKKVEYSKAKAPEYSNLPHVKSKSTFSFRYTENSNPPVVEVNAYTAYRKNRYDVFYFDRMFSHCGVESIRDNMLTVTHSNTIAYPNVISLGSHSIVSYLVNFLFGKMPFFPFDECWVKKDWVIRNFETGFVDVEKMITGYRDNKNFIINRFFKYHDLSVPKNKTLYLDSIARIRNILKHDEGCIFLCSDDYEQQDVDRLSSILVDKYNLSRFTFVSLNGNLDKNNIITPKDEIVRHYIEANKQQLREYLLSLMMPQ